MEIERMSDFFTTRVDGYDEHMLRNVEGCKEGYIKLAELIPEGTFIISIILSIVALNR